MGFWRILYSGDDTRLLLRQRAPEVVIFRGCRLEAWYHSSANGLFVRRMRSVTIQSALERFLAAARGGRPPDIEGQDLASAADGLDPQTPAAILRRRGAGALGLEGKYGLPDVPMASVLTVQELTEMFQRAQNGIEDEGADVWSVQTITRPAEDIRVVCAYHCDATGLERNDIFGRSYSKVYNTLRSKDVIVPSAEAVIAEDRCLPISAAQRAAVEAKVLGIVRFASRFHSLELEGFVLEFVFDSRSSAVLHGCWCASVFGADVKRKFRSGSAVTRSGPTGGPPAPRVFPVPAPSVPTTRSVPPTSDSGQTVAAGRGAHAPPAEPVAAEAAVAPTPSFGSLPPGGAGRACMEQQRGAADVSEALVLLEVWRGDEFVGETVVNCAIDEQQLRLHAAGHADADGRTRVDRRKQSASAVSEEALIGAFVLVGASWRHSGDGRAPLLCFSLRWARGLPAPQMPSPGLRALLWMQRRDVEASPVPRSPRSPRPSPGGFSPLWGSAVAEDAADGTGASWEESVELRMEDCQAAGRAAPEVFAMGVPQVEWNFAPGADPETGVDGWDIRGRSVELKRVLRSARDHVCGAQWNAHWGTCAEDGTMRGSTLAAQVCQRWGMEKMHRSHLLSQLSYHVDQFSDLQQAWEADIQHAQEAVKTQQVGLEGEQRECARIRNETTLVVKEKEKRLAETCRQMCSALDDHRIREHMDNVALEQSKQRIAEQRTMVHQLIDKSHSLQGALDRTVLQFDEVSTSYAQVQGEILRSQVLRPRTVQDLDDSIGQAQAVKAEVAEEEQNLIGLKTKLRMLQDELHRERDVAVRFEGFLRKMAQAPAARLRTGGGFQLDRTAKSEALAMLEEIDALHAPRAP